MVVPPQEPDQAPELVSSGACEHCPPGMLRLNASSHLEGKLPPDNEKSTSKH